jgi:hypothetical protein
MRLPTVSQYCASLADYALTGRQTYLGYLEALLQAELEEPDAKR